MRELLARLLSRKRTRQKKTLQNLYPQYRIGKGSYGYPEISFGGGATLEIGNYCSFAAGINILLGGEHQTKWVTTYPFNVFWPAAQHIQGQPHSKGNIVIGNDVWIAGNATILSGVSIGDGAVVGYGAVVTRDVEPYAIVAGNPARLVRKRFDDVTVDRLLRLRWWDWDEKKIEHFLPLLLQADIKRFLDEAEQYDSQG